MRTQFSKQDNRGAVLLIAVLMTSVVLSVGMGIYQRTYKSLVFSSFWKQTQIAFAAADAGFECALYLDTHPTAEAKCFRINAGWSPGEATPPAGVDLLTVSGGCVNIRVSKTVTSEIIGTPPVSVDTTHTHIEARGYNDACGSTNPRRVERALKIDY